MTNAGKKRTFSTFSVIERVHVSADVTLQVAVEMGSRGKESEADGHQLPASLQTVIAEILCSLTTQLNVKLIAQALVTPSAHHHLPKTESQSDTYLLLLLSFREQTPCVPTT